MLMHEAVEYTEQCIISQLQAQLYVYIHSHPMIQVQNRDVTIILCKPNLQDAQLSQRDSAAGCVIVFAKSRRLELGDKILRTL